MDPCPDDYIDDSDGDGVCESADNCPQTPNGPSLGTCTAGSNTGDSCINDADCGTDGYCSINQENFDSDGMDDACDLDDDNDEYFDSQSS